MHIPERWQSPFIHRSLICVYSYQVEHFFYLNILNFKKIVQSRAVLWIMLKRGLVSKYVWLCNPKSAIPWDNINIDIMFGQQMSRCRVLSNEDFHPILLLHQLMNMDKPQEAALDMYPQQKVNVSGI